MKKIKNNYQNILSIDATQYGQVIFELIKSHYQSRVGWKTQSFRKVYEVLPQMSDKILEYLALFLKVNKITRLKPSKSEEDLLTEIVLYKRTGAGFTGLRIVGAIAQALSLVWEVPLKIKQKPQLTRAN